MAVVEVEVIPLAAIPWRLVGAVGLVAAVALMGWRVSAWKASHEALPEVRAALAAEVECKDGSECAKRQAALQEAVGREQIRVVTAYEAELAAARSRQPISVRVCDRGGLPLSGAAGGAGAAGAAAAGALPGQAAGDREIGPALSALALEADELLARCRALTRWTTALSAAE